jgi:hypothetical protein
MAGPGKTLGSPHAIRPCCEAIHRCIAADTEGEGPKKSKQKPEVYGAGCPRCKATDPNNRRRLKGDVITSDRIIRGRIFSDT